MTVLIVIGILMLLIVAHELGHFFVAKLFRVRVEEFGVGYPPRAFLLGKWGHTEYTLNWIPFGGFVRLYGDVGEEKHGPGSFVHTKRPVQAAILVAGVVANMIAAWMLFTVALHLGVPQVVEEAIPGVPAHLIVSDIVAASPADVAGIKPGDEIVSVVDAKGEVPTLNPQSVVDFVKVRGGKDITITYKHADVTSSTTIVPANAVLPQAAGQPALGIALALVADASLPWGEAAVRAFHQTGSALVLVASDLWRLVSGSFTGTADIKQVVGPVGIVSFVGEASENGFGSVLLLAAMISINLAIINLVPIPALDGGRLFVLGIESIIRRPTPRLFTQVLNAAGFGIIILLMIVVTYNDIGRLLV